MWLDKTGLKELLLLLSCFEIFAISEIACLTGSKSGDEIKPLSVKQLRPYLTRLMSTNESARSCPAPSLPVTDQECRAKSCVGESDCPQKNQSCCFNGCIFTCVEKMAPPPVIDWEEEPIPVPLIAQDETIRRCTTSPRLAPSEPVGCPAGYVCRIQEPGDPLEGVVSSGVCVPQTQAGDYSTDDTSTFREKTGKETVYLPGGCVLSEQQYSHMQEFMQKSYVVDCFCIEGSVECQVSV